MLLTTTNTNAKEPNSKVTSYYGQSIKPNIGKITFGNYEFEPWFGNPAYFYPTEGKLDMLGYSYSNLVTANPNNRLRPKNYDKNDCFVDHLFVCEFCFKYSSNESQLIQHSSACKYNTDKPEVGKLVYYDKENRIIVREVQGFKDLLFCQSLSLFGKLFLDDKSVYYNLDHFNFYIYYGIDGRSSKYIPMGFFSKEMIAYDPTINLACICVFPPFQNRHIGSFLIELSYHLASNPQSGPEVPLSPYGKIVYLKYWSRRLASIIWKEQINGETSYTLDQLSNVSGFRKEDILYTLEHMNILATSSKNEVVHSIVNFKNWLQFNNISANQNLLDTKSIHV
ncbi:SAS2 [Candida pseudojiufengensis]|uniref:SAS2 n=1 Tax=Candida pseudojiufengensis TaxID=497109 RepID=UPI0022245337|nr:SAS2 [Candida pseudojiufengensis]KAI5964724.1 SAS2 [Candida pseudojiufengensis]